MFHSVCNELPDSLVTLGNQIKVVVFNVPQLTQASFLQKNQTLQNVFLIWLNLYCREAVRHKLKNRQFLIPPPHRVHVVIECPHIKKTFCNV